MQQSICYSQLCTEFTHQLSYNAIPPQAIAQIKHYLLDYLGCMIKGYHHKHAAPAKAYLHAMQGTPQATVLGESTPLTITQSAFFHGYLGHILEMDDVDRESITHPATVVIPAALAVGEWQRKTGEQLLTAIVAGYEVMLAIGAAITPAHYKIWHTTATAGAFGSAMAAGKLFHLSPQALDWALGNAGTMAAGLWQFLSEGAMSKFLHTGRAAENGVLAAYLASQNFTGAQHILEGKQGFFAGFAHQTIDDDIFQQLGKRFRTSTVSIKPYPCCRHTHSSIDAANKLRELVPLDQIEKIAVKTYSNALQVANKQDPQTPQEAKFSLKFCVARTLIEGLLTERSFTEQTLHDPLMRALMAKIEIEATPEQDAKLPRYWPSCIEAKYQNQLIQVSVDSPKGDPDNPLNWQDVVHKFELMTEGLITKEGQHKIAELCLTLETQPNISILMKTVNQHLVLESHR